MALRSKVTGQRERNCCYYFRRPMGQCDTDAKLFKKIEEPA